MVLRMNGEALRERRESAGLTQRQLAGVLGISQQAISRIERGELRLPAAREYLLERILPSSSERPT